MQQAEKIISTSKRLAAATVFVGLILYEFYLASYIGLIKLSNPIVHRAEILLTIIGFIIGLCLDPIISLYALVGGCLYAGLIAIFFSLIIACVYWVYTGNTIHYTFWFRCSFFFMLPFNILFWGVSHRKSEPTKKKVNSKILKTPNPSMVIICGVFSLICTIITAWLKSGLPWIDFIKITFGG